MRIAEDVALGTLVERIATWNPSSSSRDGWFDYIDLSAVDQHSKRIVEARKVLGSDAPSRARQIVATDDVLVSTVRPNLNGVAQVPCELDGATASTGFCVLRPKADLLDACYLFQWVKSPQFISEMVRRATGASYPAVSDRIILESSIPLPPLPEQRRIAAILDQAEALRAKRWAAGAELDTLLWSSFFDFFGDPVTNPRGCKRIPLAELSNINDCPHSTPSWTIDGMVCLRTSNLTEGGWNWNDKRFVSEATYVERTRRGVIESGDIILSREGTVGVAAIVQEDMQVCMGQRLVQVRPARSLLTPEFLLLHLLYVLSPSRISRLMVGSTAQHLNVKDLKALKIPVPPLEDQQSFAALASKIEQLKTAQRTSSGCLDALFTSLQHRAFRGEL